MVPTIVVVSSHVEAREALVSALNARFWRCCSVGLAPVDLPTLRRPEPGAVVTDLLISCDTVLEGWLAALSPRPALITIVPGDWWRGELKPGLEEQLVEQLVGVVPSLRRLHQVLQAVAEIVEGGQRSLVARWIQQLTLVPAFAAQPELPLPALAGEVASIIKVTVDALRGRVGRAGCFPGAAAHAAGVAHARVRMQQAIPAGVVVQEYQILRHELWQVIRPALILQGPTAADVVAVSERLQSSIDSLTAVTIQEYSRQNCWHVEGKGA